MNKHNSSLLIQYLFHEIAKFTSGLNIESNYQVSEIKKNEVTVVVFLNSIA